MILPIRVAVDGDVGITLALEQFGDNVVDFHTVAFAIGRGSIGTRDTSGHLTGVRRVVSPRRRIAVGGGEVRVGRVPVKSTVDSGTSTKQAPGEGVNVLAPPEGIGILEHGLFGFVSGD